MNPSSIGSDKIVFLEGRPCEELNALVHFKIGASPFLYQKPEEPDR
jgi:hypothetical protein